MQYQITLTKWEYFGLMALFITGGVVAGFLFGVATIMMIV